MSASVVLGRGLLSASPSTLVEAGAEVEVEVVSLPLPDLLLDAAPVMAENPRGELA